MHLFSSPYPIRNVSLDTSDIGVKPVFWLYLIQPFNNQPFLTYKMTSDNSRKPDTLTIELRWNLHDDFCSYALRLKVISRNLSVSYLLYLILCQESIPEKQIFTWKFLKAIHWSRDKFPNPNYLHAF